jgi:hypothetical protein
MLLGIILGCTISLPLSIETINHYFECRDRQEIVDHMEDYHQVVLDNFEIHDFEKAIRIMFCESSGRQYAINKNNNGTKDKGLWQFNDITWKWLKDKLGFKYDRFDIVGSTKIASWLAYNDGWHHWNSSKSCWGL